MFQELWMDASYIKTGILNGAVMGCVDMKPLILAFVGFNEEQTRAHFRQFAEDNAEQVHAANLEQGWIRLYDGTVILRVSAEEKVRLWGVRFDQIILADDRRMMIWKERRHLLRLLNLAAARRSNVPQEFRFQVYDVDAPEV